MKKLIVEHWLAIGLAVLISIIAVAPQAYFRYEHRNDAIYGIELLPDSPWTARVREIQDGLGFGNMYQKDGKDNPYLFQPLGSMVVAHMGSMFKLDINDTILFSRLYLPFVTFLLIYTFVLLLSRDKLAALCSATVLLFADSILSFSGIIKLLGL